MAARPAPASSLFQETCAVTCMGGIVDGKDRRDRSDDCEELRVAHVSSPGRLPAASADDSDEDLDASDSVLGEALSTLFCASGAYGRRHPVPSMTYDEVMETTRPLDGHTAEVERIETLRRSLVRELERMGPRDPRYPLVREHLARLEGRAEPRGKKMPHDFDVSVFAWFRPMFFTVCQELAERKRFVQKSADTI